MSKKIYVGNLPFDVTEDEVRETFGAHGEVESIAMIKDRETGKFRGFCFVEMADSDADEAIKALNDFEFGGRAMKVNEARPREERSGGGRGGYGGGGGRGGYGGGGGYNDGGRGGYSGGRDRDRRDRNDY